MPRAYKYVPTHGTLARLTPADLEQVFPPLDAARLAGEVIPARSRQWIIWRVLEHDIHHGSEISTILGVHGLPVVELD